MKQKSLIIDSSQKEMEEYIRIIFSFNAEEKEMSILSRFFSFFPQEDIFFEIRDGKLIIFLKQLDFSYLGQQGEKPKPGLGDNILYLFQIIFLT